MKAKKPEIDPEAASELNLVMKSIDRLGSTQPRLAGIRSLLAIDQQRLGRGFKDADLEILVGAIYLEAIRQLQSIPVNGKSAKLHPPATRRRRITEADVKTLLSKPINSRPYGHAYFARILDEAKEKLVSDPLYHRQLSAAQGSASRKTCLGGTPRWICWGMAGVLVLGLILLVVL
jgi:hypothetical protein